MSSARPSTRGVSRVLERMTLDEWDELRAGRVSANELRAKYLDDEPRDEQTDLSGWSA